MERAASYQQVILPSIYIPKYGFGIIETVVQIQEALFSGRIQFTYEMSCGDLITTGDACAPLPCVVCMSGLSYKASDADPRWLARPCKKHFARCAYPGCGWGLCSTHLRFAGDRLPYCPIHYQQVEKELDPHRLLKELVRPFFLP